MRIGVIGGGAWGTALAQVAAADGQPVDPARAAAEHEAMAQVPSPDHESGSVVQVYQSGYRINGAVLRPARVVVAQ